VVARLPPSPFAPRPPKWKSSVSPRSLRSTPSLWRRSEQLLRSIVAIVCSRTSPREEFRLTVAIRTLGSHDAALAKPVENPVQFGVQRESFQGFFRWRRRSRRYRAFRQRAPQVIASRRLGTNESPHSAQTCTIPHLFKPHTQIYGIVILVPVSQTRQDRFRVPTRRAASP
jgi:hypothetical protein